MKDYAKNSNNGKFITYVINNCEYGLSSALLYLIDKGFTESEARTYLKILLQDIK